MLYQYYCTEVNNEIVAKRFNPALSKTIKEVWAWKEQDISEDDVIDRLRARTVPSGYPTHPWRKGTG